VQRAELDFGTHVYPHIVGACGVHGTIAGVWRGVYNNDLGNPSKFDGSEARFLADLAKGSAATNRLLRISIIAHCL
jgi:hypothetical protein